MNLFCTFVVHLNAFTFSVYDKDEEATKLSPHLFY